MKKLVLGSLGAALVLLTVAAGRIGGWAVVNVAKLPDHLVVGKPAQFTFSVRQHGDKRIPGLKPRIVARSGSQTITASAWELTETAGYRAQLTVPRAGLWHVTIESGFGRSRGQLLPIPAVDSTARKPAEPSDAEWGKLLFASKGCVTCHVHRAVDIVGEVSGLGPDLTERRFPADYLAKYLADPSIKPAISGNSPRMPNPDLKDKDIPQLVAFLNSERRVTTR